MSFRKEGTGNTKSLNFERHLNRPYFF